MSLTAAFQEQAESCAALGSPFMARLLTLLAKNWPSQSALDRRVASFEGDIGPAGHSVPLRIASALHALVLAGSDKALAEVYPPRAASEQTLREAVLAALDRHEAFILKWIESPPQTNEVRRAAALIAGAQVAVQHANLPIHLSELGASSGLNMHWDSYALDIKGRRFGQSMPAIILAPDWQGAPPPAGRTPQIASRAGVDLNPLDPRRNDHLMRLMAYLWPDQPERLKLTRAAASVAGTPPAQGDAIEWLNDRLLTAPQGRLHLIQHTVAWQYFDKASQKRGKALIEAAGARARPNRPLAWLSMEADGDTGAEGAALTLRLWPGDLRLDLGRVDFHGRWVDWRYSG